MSIVLLYALASLLHLMLAGAGMRKAGASACGTILSNLSHHSPHKEAQFRDEQVKLYCVAFWRGYLYLAGILSNRQDMNHCLDASLRDG